MKTLVISVCCMLLFACNTGSDLTCRTPFVKHKDDDRCVCPDGYTQEVDKCVLGSADGDAPNIWDTSEKDVADVEKEEVETLPPLDLPYKETQHTRGNKDAKLVLKGLIDLSCPYCLLVQPTLAMIMDEYKDELKYQIYLYPSSVRSDSMLAAMAAECAGGLNKFWEMHDMIFDNGGKRTRSDLDKYATEIGLDMAIFNQCMSFTYYKSKIENTKKICKSMFGKCSFPRHVVGETIIGGTAEYDEFKQAIDAELAKLEAK